MKDPYLGNLSHKILTVTKLFQKLHPGAKYYLTNIQANDIEPEDIRQWSSDLWLFPYCTNCNMVPYDARSDGPAAVAYPNAESGARSSDNTSGSSFFDVSFGGSAPRFASVAVVGFNAVLVAVVFLKRANQKTPI